MSFWSKLKERFTKKEKKSEVSSPADVAQTPAPAVKENKEPELKEKDEKTSSSSETPQNRTEEVYNEDGSLKEQRVYMRNAAGKEVLLSKTTYKNGVKYSETHYNTKGKGWIRRKYNTNGTLKSVTSKIYDNKKLAQTTVATYDEKGQIKSEKKKEFDENGLTCTITTNYRRNPEGKLVSSKTTYKDPNKNTTKIVQTKYDENQKKSYETVKEFDENGNLWSSSKITAFDENGNPTVSKEKRFDKDHKLSYTKDITRGEKTDIIIEREYNTDKYVTSTKRTELDKDGNILSSRARHYNPEDRKNKVKERMAHLQDVKQQTPPAPTPQEEKSHQTAEEILTQKAAELDKISYIDEKDYPIRFTDYTKDVDGSGITETLHTDNMRSKATKYHYSNKQLVTLAHPKDRFKQACTQNLISLTVLETYENNGQQTTFSKEGKKYIQISESKDDKGNDCWETIVYDDKEKPIFYSKNTKGQDGWKNEASVGKLPSGILLTGSGADRFILTEHSNCLQGLSYDVRRNKDEVKLMKLSQQRLQDRA